MDSLTIHEILEHLPHRYPFLLIDRVLDYKANSYLTGIKNVTYNEPFFAGHFPHRKIMPGVLILESLAQATGILAFKSLGKIPDENSLYYLVGIDNARFKRPVEPGDQLKLHVDVIKCMRGICKFETKATVDDELVCTATTMCAERGII